MARRVVKTRDAMELLFSEIGPHFAKFSKGGYTRVLGRRSSGEPGLGGTPSRLGDLEC